MADGKAYEALVVPANAPGLPVDLFKAVASLRRAAQSVGDQTFIDAAARSYDAFERAMKWLEREGVITVPRGGAAEHNERIKIASHDPRLMLVERDLRRLREWARGDTYGDDAKGRPVTISPRDARCALAIGIEAVRRIGSCRLSGEQIAVLEELLDLSAVREAHAGLLGAIKWAVVRGQYGGPLDMELERLARLFRRPQTHRERIVAGNVALMLAHRGMNQGVRTGRSGALAWSEHAIGMLQGVPQEMPHLVHLHALRSIVRAHEMDMSGAAEELSAGFQLARGHPELVAQLQAEQVMLLTDSGQADRARGLAIELLDAARGEGDADSLATSHRKVGAVFRRTGWLDRAEEHLLLGLDLAPDSYVMARSVAATDLMEFYVQTEELDKAVTYAKLVSQLSTERGLSRQVQKAQHILRLAKTQGREQ